MGRSTLPLLVLVLALPSGAWAQIGSTGQVRARGGLTFAAKTAPVFGAGFGINAGPSVQILGEIGRMQNVLPSDIQQEFDDGVTGLQSQIGLPVRMDVKAQADYALGGARFLIPATGRIRPYMEGTGGIAHVAMKFDIEVGGVDYSDEFANEIGEDAETNEFMLSLGGGVQVALTTHFGVDIGYRFVRIFTDDPSVTANKIYAAAVFGF